MQTGKSGARKELRKAVEMTKAEIEDAVRGIDPTDLKDLAGGTVAKGRNKVGGTSRKAKRRAKKARRTIEKALPDLPSSGVVTRKHKKGRSKTPLLVVLLGAAGAAVFRMRKGK